MSVIIPVYNVEIYLDKCLKSVLAQTYRNLEIVLVDDGSTDRSGLMCDEYAKKDARIRVIHKQNGGLSDARNVALDIVQGDYVTFVDSDDYVDKRLVDRLLVCATQKQCDLVVGGFVKCIAEVEDDRNDKEEQRQTILSAEDAIERMLYRKGVPTYAHGKLYKSCLFEEIRFPVGKLFEDIITVYKVLKKVNKIGIVDYPMYYYRQRQGSIVNFNFRPNRLHAVEHALEILEDMSCNKKKQNAAEAYLFFVLMDNYALVGQEHAKEKLYLEQLIKTYRKSVVCNSRESLSLRVMAMMTYFPGMRFARFVGRVYKQRKQQKWIKEAAKKA